MCIAAQISMLSFRFWGRAVLHAIHPEQLLNQPKCIDAMLAWHAADKVSGTIIHHAIGLAPVQKLDDPRAIMPRMDVH